MPEDPGTFPDLLSSRLDNLAVLLRSQPTQRPTTRGNADEGPAEAGKRHLPLLSTRERSLTSSSSSRHFLATSLGHRPRMWLELNELQRRKVEEVGEAIQAIISHTVGVSVIVGLP